MATAIIDALLTKPAGKLPAIGDDLPDGEAGSGFSAFLADRPGEEEPGAITGSQSRKNIPDVIDTGDEPEGQASILVPASAKDHQNVAEPWSHNLDPMFKDAEIAAEQPSSPPEDGTTPRSAVPYDSVELASKISSTENLIAGATVKKASKTAETVRETPKVATRENILATRLEATQRNTLASPADAIARSATKDSTIAPNANPEDFVQAAKATVAKTERPLHHVVSGKSAPSLTLQAQTDEPQSVAKLEASGEANTLTPFKDHAAMAHPGAPAKGAAQIDAPDALVGGAVKTALAQKSAVPDSLSTKETEPRRDDQMQRNAELKPQVSSNEMAAAPKASSPTQTSSPQAAVIQAVLAAKPDDESVAKADRLGADLQATPGAARSATIPDVGTSAAPQTVSAAKPEQIRHIMVQIAQAGAPNSQDTIQIKLSPEELGTVTYRLANSETGAVVLVTADRPETLDLLRRNAEILRAEFAAMGLDTNDLSFGDGNHDFEDAEPGSIHTEETDAGHVPEIDQPHPRHVVTGIGVDMRL